MAANQAERPQFYEGQYLGAADMAAVAEHARLQRARHDLGAHTWGIAAGLQLQEVTVAGDQIEVYVLPGYAWDGFGRPIVVLAPYKLPGELFNPFLFDAAIDNGTPAGRLVDVWLRYDEVAAQSPRPGFEVCDPEAPFARVQETFRIEVGRRQNLVDRQDQIAVGGYALYAQDTLQRFDPHTTPTVLHDESVAFQQLPAAGERKRWLIPLGAVRWRPDPDANQPGKFVKREPADLDYSRSLRRYAGVVAGAVQAADRNIRLRDRTRPYSAVQSDDLVWAEGNVRVEGDARLFGGKLDWREASGQDGGVPLDIRRAIDTVRGDTMLQVAIGEAAAGHNRFAVGPLKAGATPTSPKVVDEKFAVVDNGNVGIGTTQPGARLEVRDGDLLLKAAAEDAGDLIFQNSSGIQKGRVWSNPGAGPALHLSSGDNTPDLTIDSTGNVGIGTSTPGHRLEIHGDDNALVLLSTAAAGIARNIGLELRTTAGNGVSYIDFTRGSTSTIGSGTPDFSGRLSYNEVNTGAFAFSGANVGIGTLTPTATLEVAGNLNVTGRVNGRDIRADGAKLDIMSTVSQIGILTGQVSDDETIPFPLGYTVSDRWWVVISPQEFISNRFVRIGAAGGAVKFLVECFYDTSRLKARVRWYQYEGASDGSLVIYPGNASFLMIAMK